MTQDERRQSNYKEVVKLLKTNSRNLSKYNLEERRLYTWLKHNRKQMNAEALSEERKEKFKELLELCEQYRRKNQYE